MLKFKKQEAARYMRSLRNPNKQTYASQYWQWLLRSERRLLGVEPEPAARGLSAMGAQSVRMSLHEFIEGRT